jgi:hypothetical protein
MPFAVIFNLAEHVNLPFCIAAAEWDVAYGLGLGVLLYPGLQG